MISQNPPQTASPTLTLHCSAYEVAFRVRVPGQSSLFAIQSVLPHGTTIVRDIPASSPTFTPAFTLDDPEEAPATLDTQLALLERRIFLHVATNAPHLIFLHAGVVGWHGHAILFPGSTCAGKTTLVAELVKRGATYYSDDYALLDASGLVHPYARDLRIRKPGHLQPQRVPVGHLAGHAGIDPIPVTHLVLTRYVLGAIWNLQALTPGQAILEALGHAVPARHRPAQTLATLRAALLDARAVQSLRGDATVTAELLLRDLDPGPSSR